MATKRHATHCVMWSGRWRYVQDSASKSSDMAQPVSCSSTPPTRAETRNTCQARAPRRRMPKQSTVSRTAPTP